jgi:hypothetical protein
LNLPKIFGVDSKHLACPAEVHDELRSDRHRLLTETVPVGAQTYNGEVLLYLRNCVTCRGTLGLEYDVDAVISGDACDVDATHPSSL